MGQSSEEDVMKFITKHITCKFPSQSEDPVIHNLVKKYLLHGCRRYCLRTFISKSGKCSKACKFGFPRKITSKFILNDPVESILGRKSSCCQKKLYYIPRTEMEAKINDYNRYILEVWQGNMDIQFIGENSYSLIHYVTKYITKADKSHLSNGDFGFNVSAKSRCYQFAFRSLKQREVGAYEICDGFTQSKPYASSEHSVFIPLVQPQFRTKMLKPINVLENTDPEKKVYCN